MFIKISKVGILSISVLNTLTVIRLLIFPVTDKTGCLLLIYIRFTVNCVPYRFRELFVLKFRISVYLPHL